MLPDFPDLKKEMDEFIVRFMRRRIEFYEGIVREIPQYTVHEGRDNSIVREDGTEEQTQIVKHEHEMSIKWKEAAHLDLFGVLRHIEKIAQEVAREKSKYFFEFLNEAADRSGNVVDGKGQPLSPETLLEALNKIEISFDQSGSMENLNIVIPPSQGERAQDIIHQLETNPELLKRHRKIMEKKKEQWRDREAARVLVG